MKIDYLSEEIIYLLSIFELWSTINSFFNIDFKMKSRFRQISEGLWLHYVRFLDSSNIFLTSEELKKGTFF